MKFRSILGAAIITFQLVALGTVSPVQAQINEFNTVVFGSRIPLYLDDPTGGMPVRNATNDHSAFVPRIAGAKVLLMSPSGTTFVTCEGNTASLWNSSNGVQLLAMQHGGPINWVSFAKDGSYIVTAGGNWMRIWDSRGEFRKQCDLKVDIQKLVVSQDGSIVVAITNDDIQVWSPSQGLLRTKIPISNRVAALIISPDASQMTVLDGTNAAIWKIKDGQMLGTIAHEEPVRAAMYSPDGKRLLVSTSQWAYLWDPVGFIKLANVQYGGGYR
ncbi:MAG: hypothetical protein IPP57_04070 [Candidatus Obscuribacter sp.]|jgi:WD40 repeat protein|nr:hypothetical protein [Candidatus Obscuribacter sp.]MDQ5968092.1 hypothetical protein [Cyanobacteriota bacterium erpe_2018_sw_39hr_WHONDRS-SW48-000098_B_bin.30]